MLGLFGPLLRGVQDVSLLWNILQPISSYNQSSVLQLSCSNASKHRPKQPSVNTRTNYGRLPCTWRCLQKLIWLHSRNFQHARQSDARVRLPIPDSSSAKNLQGHAPERSNHPPCFVHPCSVTALYIFRVPICVARQIPRLNSTAGIVLKMKLWLSLIWIPFKDPTRTSQ
jgi:hypothetical protein